MITKWSAIHDAFTQLHTCTAPLGIHTTAFRVDGVTHGRPCLVASSVCQENEKHRLNYFDGEEVTPNHKLEDEATREAIRIAS